MLENVVSLRQKKNQYCVLKEQLNTITVHLEQAIVSLEKAYCTLEQSYVINEENGAIKNLKQKREILISRRSDIKNSLLNQVNRQIQKLQGDIEVLEFTQS